VLDFRLLGPVEVADESRIVPLGGPRQRATLAILLLSANRVVSVDRLADELYAGAPPVTAVTQIQRQISDLRKALGHASAIATRPPGYVIRLAPEQLDLHRFERLTEEAANAAALREWETARALLRRAEGLWRGAPLDDFAYEPFAQTAIRRLDELRLGALEQRIEAELALGRHAEVIGELEGLLAENPLRERLCIQLMLALYRSRRQAEALEVYRKAHEVLVEDFGLEPSPELRALEHAMLTHDPALEAGVPAPPARQPGAVLVVPSVEDAINGLLAIARPLASVPPRDLIVALLVQDEGLLGAAVEAMHGLRVAGHPPLRTAAFTTSDRATDISRLISGNDVALVVVNAPADVGGDALPDDFERLLSASTADVALLTGATAGTGGEAGIFVPFGGGEHDWAALELAAWLASATGSRLRLIGTSAAPAQGNTRDASRLLADASLAVQRVVGIDAEPRLATPTEESLLAAVRGATLVVLGVPSRWRSEGIGSVRRALVGAAQSPVLLVHRGPRPGGLAPDGSRTRFTWSLHT
jgi:DNA-binding SARP family transcriptional activator/nucleotide-binding universal stress UspA family protein